MRKLQTLKNVILISLIVLIAPLSAEAGLIRVDFDLVEGRTSAFGLGYMQFDDEIEFGTSTSINSLVDFKWNIGVAWIDQSKELQAVIPGEGEGKWYGDIIISETGEDTYEARFTEHYFYRYFDMGDATFIYSDETVYSENDWPWINYEGTFKTSVWFDDPVAVPVPSSLMLLLSALVPIYGFKRKQQQH